MVRTPVGARKVCLDETGLQIQGEKRLRDKEVLGEKVGQGSRSLESQHFQQFKVIELCVREIRKRTEEFFGFEEMPRRIKEALVVCEREIDKRMVSMRMRIGASTLVRDLEVVGGVRKWKKAVSEAMEERIKERNLEVGQGD